MQAVLCEVVGCHSPAAWIRVENINCRHENLLCDCCWHILRNCKPLEAACYASSEAEHTSRTEFYREVSAEFEDEAVITIN